jgi:hypothetical protein
MDRQIFARSRRWRRVLAFTGCLLALATSCGKNDAMPGAGPTVDASPTVTATLEMPAWPTADMRDLPDPVVRVREVAALAANVPLEQVEIVEYVATEWPSTAFGCPVPGMFYAQVITPGYRVVAKVGGETFDYHTDLRAQVVRCES